MARENINVGTVANDGTGDPVRNAYIKVNNMTSEIYTALGDGSILDSYVASTGTPLVNQFAVFGSANSIQGDTNLTWDGAILTMVGNINITGFINGRGIATDGTKLDGIEANATADQTGAEIKIAYEAEADTNAFTDAEQTKLTGIEAGAERSTPEIVSVGTSRDLLLTDERDILEIDTTGGAVAITIPTNASVAFPIGTIINMTLLNTTNAATVVGAVGVTLNGVLAGTGTITATAYVGVALYKKGTDEWIIQGDIGTVV